MSPIVTVVTPGMERRRPTGRGLLAEPRGSRCRHVSRRGGGGTSRPPKQEGKGREGTKQRPMHVRSKMKLKERALWLLGVVLSG